MIHAVQSEDMLPLIPREVLSTVRLSGPAGVTSKVVVSKLRLLGAIKQTDPAAEKEVLRVLSSLSVRAHSKLEPPRTVIGGPAKPLVRAFRDADGVVHEGVVRRSKQPLLGGDVVYVAVEHWVDPGRTASDVKGSAVSASAAHKASARGCSLCGDAISEWSLLGGGYNDDRWAAVLRVALPLIMCEVWFPGQCARMQRAKSRAGGSLRGQRRTSRSVAAPCRARATRAG